MSNPNKVAPLSPGFGTLDTSTLKHTAPLSQSGSVDGDGLPDPLEGIGSTTDNNSGNPFDEDTFGTNPGQPTFNSQNGHNNNNNNNNTNSQPGNSNRGTDNGFFGEHTTFEQPQNVKPNLQQTVSFNQNTGLNQMGNVQNGNNTPFGNVNQQQLSGMNMRGNQQMGQQMNTQLQGQGFMHNQGNFPFDANTFGNQVQVQNGQQMYTGVIPGQMAQFNGQTGMMQMPYTYVMTPGFAPGTQFTTTGQQQTFTPQTSAQVSVTTVQAQPKKSTDHMFSQLNPLDGVRRQ
jgi:hypothetical protein